MKDRGAWNKVFWCLESCSISLPLLCFLMRMAKILEFKALSGHLPPAWIQKIHSGQVKDKSKVLDLVILLKIPIIFLGTWGDYKLEFLFSFSLRQSRSRMLLTMVKCSLQQTMQRLSLSSGTHWCLPGGVAGGTNSRGGWLCGTLLSFGLGERTMETPGSQRQRSETKWWIVQLINEEGMRELEFHHFTNP